MAPKKRKQIPVTVLSGFLGAGKTTLLNHILSNQLLRIAVIVNDMSSINIDAQLVKRTEEKMIELSNGCICCTLREDLIEQVVLLAKDTGLDAIVIESTGIGEPIHIAETFAHAQNISIGKELPNLVRLDTMVTVVDSWAFLQHARRKVHQGQGIFSTVVTTCDKDRTITDLLIDQIHFADLVILNKIDKLSADDTKEVQAIVKDLNPKCKLISTNFGIVPLTDVFDTKSYSIKKAEKNAQWFASAWGTSVPESEEYGISSVVFRAKRAFHPQRLHTLFQATKLDEGSNLHDEVAGNPFSAVIRCKGFVWLATNFNNFIVMHMAGGSLRLSLGKPWWVNVPKADWPVDSEVFNKEVLSNWDEAVGDRGQTLVVIGVKMNKQAVLDCLQACLLSDQEIALGENELSRLPMPFEIVQSESSSCASSSMSSTAAAPESSAERDIICQDHIHDNHDHDSSHTHNTDHSHGSEDHECSHHSGDGVDCEDHSDTARDHAHAGTCDDQHITGKHFIHNHEHNHASDNTKRQKK